MHLLDHFENLTHRSGTSVPDDYFRGRFENIIDWWNGLGRAGVPAGFILGEQVAVGSLYYFKSPVNISQSKKFLGVPPTEISRKK